MEGDYDWIIDSTLFDLLYLNYAWYRPLGMAASMSGFDLRDDVKQWQVTWAPICEVTPQMIAFARLHREVIDHIQRGDSHAAAILTRLLVRMAWVLNDYRSNRAID
jgi:hypothetical protein